MLQKNYIDVRYFGAVGDGKTVNTSAIQSAINYCRAGDVVVISEGVYISGALFLKGDMTFRVEKNAKLLGSDDLSEYPIMKYRFEGQENDCYASLLNTVDTNGKSLKNIRIDGGGVIDANGKALFDQVFDLKKEKRGRAVCLRKVENVEIEDITIRQSPAWCLHFIYCNHVKIHNIKIFTKRDESGKDYEICNGDGIDIDSSRYVVISDSFIDSQDDCIAIKSGKDEEGRSVGISTEKVVVDNCMFQSGFGVAIGSEMSGDIRDIVVKNCTFQNTYSVASIKAPRGRGGVIERITFKDCTHTNQSTEYTDCKWFRGAIYIDQFYGQETVDVLKKEKITEGTATIRDILFQNITVDTIAGNAVFLAGLPENPMKNIRLEKIYAKGKYGLKAYQVSGLVLNQVTVFAEEGEAIELEKVAQIDGFSEPKAEYTPIPFWFWNDELNEAELLCQMSEMKKKGVDAFVIHPRIGLPEHMEYLSEEFMHYVEFVVEQAHKMHMKVVLYDEGMYPSGSANGGVVRSNPAFASQGLSMRNEPSENPEDILVAEEGAYYFYLEKSNGTIRGIHYGEDDGEENAPKSADLLNRDAVTRFIELTHEKYYAKLSKYFGTTIIAMFTDEPDILGRNAKKGLIPWTTDFLDYYLKEGGKKEDLPALFSEGDSKEKRVYQEIVHKKLSESYYRQLADWCTAHKIALTGHPQKSEDIGLLADFTIPCQDIVWRFIAPKDGSGTIGVHSTMGKCSSDSARHRKKRRNGNECFGCCSLPETPYDFSKEDMKWYLDWLFVRGVNLVYPHAFFYSITEQRKAERPPDVGMHSAFWEEYHKISDYIKRMCYLMTDSVNQAKTAILCTKDQLSWKVAKPLYENQIEFNYLEEDLLAECEYLPLEKKLRIADQTYELLLLDGQYKEETYALLKQWKKDGFKIIQVSEQRLHLLPNEVKQQINPDISTETPQRELRMTHIKKDEKDILIFTNEGEREIDTTLEVHFGNVTEIWDAETGEKRKLDEINNRIQLKLGYRKSTIFIVNKK